MAQWQAVLTFGNNCKMGRNVGQMNESAVSLLKNILGAHHELLPMQDYAIRTIRVRRLSHNHLGNAQSCHATNICGSVVHAKLKEEHDDTVLHSGIRACLKVNNSSFGLNRRLHGSLGNITINENKSIYRGFRSTADVMEMLDHVFKPESIQQNTLHMIVMTAHLGSLVFINTEILDCVLRREHFEATPRWRAVPEQCLDDVNPVKIIQLCDFDKSWLREQGAESVIRVKMHVTSRGLVNIFVSIDNTPLVVDFELQLLPFCNFLVELVKKYT